MWPLDDPSVGREMVELLEADAFVWFDRFGSRAAILSALESATATSHEVSGEGPDRLLAVRMRLGAGDRRRAQELFDDWVNDCRARVAVQPHLKRHLEVLDDFAAQACLTMPPA